MIVVTTAIPGVLIIEPRVLGDALGFFTELFEQERYAASGIAGPFVQDNFSRSSQGVLRGLHLQHPKPQGKLVSVLHGRVRDVTVDVRVGSPTFGRHVIVELDDEKRRRLWVPRGFAVRLALINEIVTVTLTHDLENRDSLAARPVAGTLIGAQHG